MRAAKAALAHSNPEGYTLAWNVGIIAGQTVGHAHLHIIARHAEEGATGHGVRCLLKAGRAFPDSLKSY